MRESPLKETIYCKLHNRPINAIIKLLKERKEQFNFDERIEVSWHKGESVIDAESTWEVVWDELGQPTPNECHYFDFYIYSPEAGKLLESIKKAIEEVGSLC